MSKIHVRLCWTDFIFGFIWVCPISQTSQRVEHETRCKTTMSLIVSYNTKYNDIFVVSDNYLWAYNSIIVIPPITSSKSWRAIERNSQEVYTWAFLRELICPNLVCMRPKNSEAIFCNGERASERAKHAVSFQIIKYIIRKKYNNLLGPKILRIGSQEVYTWALLTLCVWCVCMCVYVCLSRTLRIKVLVRGSWVRRAKCSWNFINSYGNGITGSSKLKDWALITEKMHFRGTGQKKRLASLWNSSVNFFKKKKKYISYINHCRFSFTALLPNIQSKYFYCVHSRQPIG